MIGTYSTLKARAAIREIDEGARHSRGGGRSVHQAAARTSRRSTSSRRSAPSRRASTDIPFDREPLRTILRARPAHRGVSPAHGDAPVRARHLPRADHGLHAAPARRQGLRDHAVVDARGRGGGAPQDRHHRPEGARRDRGGRRDGGGERRAPAPSRADRLPRRPGGARGAARGAHRRVLLHRVPRHDPAHPAGALRRLRGAHGALVDHTAGRVELRRQAPVSPPAPRARAGRAHSPGARARARATRAAASSIRSR